MKPIIHEQDGVRVAVAVQVIRPGRAAAARGRSLTHEDRQERADRRAEQLEFAALCVRFAFAQAVYLIGLGFACAFWCLGRLGDGLRQLEASMGGSQRQLVPGMLPPWMRPQHTALPAPRRFDSGHRLTTGDDDAELDD